MSNRIVPVSVIAKLFDCSERNVQKLAKEDVIPKPETGGYDLVGCVQAYIRSLRRKNKFGDLGDEMEASKLRISKEQALKLELENRRKQGDLLPKSEVQKEVGNAFSNVRTRLLAIPTKAAPEVFGKESRAEIESILKDLIHESLVELALCELYENK